MKYISFLLVLIISLTGYGQVITHPVVNTDSVINVTVTTISKSTVTPPVNKPPICFAGSAQTITLPLNGVTLAGTASDPDGTIATILWSKTSGTGGIIGSPASLSTLVTGLTQGSYIFKLTVTDNQGATASSSITVTVNPALPPPDTSGTAFAGFGINAIGGSQSSTVVHITNLSQFAGAIGSNKTLIFDVSGTITGRFDLINISFLTIDAYSTGKDITIVCNDGDGVSFDGSGTHNCILRGIRVINSPGGDGINVINGSHDIIIDHCSSYGNADGNIDIAGDNSNPTQNVTVQWSIMLGGNTSSFAGDMLITSQNVSTHHNLYSPATANQPGERLPFVHANYDPVGKPNADIRNNIMWKWGRNNGTGSGYATGIAYNATANIVNNYYYSIQSPGSATNTDDGYGSGATGKAFMSGNVSGNSGVNPNSRSNVSEFIIPSVNQIPQQDACTAARKVLAKVGTAVRNSTELAVINSINLPGCP